MVATTSGASATGHSNELLERVAARDHQAFRSLYDRHGSTLFGLCVTIMRDSDRALDVFQDACVKIWANASRYDPERGEAIAWMVTVTRRCALDHLRRHARLPIPDSELVAVTADDRADEPPDRDHLLRQCLERLPPQQGRAIALAYAHGLTHDELARQLARPLGTVKSWVRRGLARLKRCLDG